MAAENKEMKEIKRLGRFGHYGFFVGRKALKGVATILKPLGSSNCGGGCVGDAGAAGLALLIALACILAVAALIGTLFGLFDVLTRRPLSTHKQQEFIGKIERIGQMPDTLKQSTTIYLITKKIKKNPHYSSKSSHELAEELNSFNLDTASDQDIQDMFNRIVNYVKEGGDWITYNNGKRLFQEIYDVVMSDAIAQLSPVVPPPPKAHFPNAKARGLAGPPRSQFKGPLPSAPPAAQNGSLPSASPAATPALNF